MSGALQKYEVVIGLEVHAQLLTRSKMFCACPNLFDDAINTRICPVCSGQPGSLPAVNRRAIELGVRAAIALNCQIREESVFARKNYFYPDLPKGYQISQYELPFCQHGFLEVLSKTGTTSKVRIHRIHFEEDAGKSVHAFSGTEVNLNRAGVPLIEIVTEPDMRSADEAGQYLRTLRNILQYAEVCDGNMEEGNFRCDANISLRPRGTEKFGTKIELKNINSFRYVEKAIEYEIERQAELLDKGVKLVQETRGWDSARGVTELMRVKEEAQDYRYFPDPDLLPLRISAEWQGEIKKGMPELPGAKRARFIETFGLSDYDASVLTSSADLAKYFESMVEITQSPKACANWVMNELLGKLNASSKEISESPVKSKQLADLVLRIEKNEISGKIAKTVFEEMFATGKDAGGIIKEQGLVQISDAGQLEPIIRKVLAANSDQVQAYKAGKVKLLGFFVGQVMKETKGQANPTLLNDAVKRLLEE